MCFCSKCSFSNIIWIDRQMVPYFLYYYQLHFDYHGHGHGSSSLSGVLFVIFVCYYNKSPLFSILLFSFYSWSSDVGGNRFVVVVVKLLPTKEGRRSTPIPELFILLLRLSIV
mmetsp:Transcript_17380/g.17482  ORF Transcript_17380/g.17482 Transcript_17380/m.17482 type:complete len:113 (+) Transcript_17380:43-381(+)